MASSNVFSSPRIRSVWQAMNKYKVIASKVVFKTGIIHNKRTTKQLSFTRKFLKLSGDESGLEESSSGFAHRYQWNCNWADNALRGYLRWPTFIFESCNECLQKSPLSNWAGLFEARLSQPRVSENFDFSFLTFWWSVLFILFALQFWAVVISN